MAKQEERGLFGELAQQYAPEGDPGLPRYVEARRDAIVFQRFEFDELIGADHPARVIWAYVEQVDLSALYEQIKARAHTPGRPAADPRVMLALWLYACVEGVGSARQLERLTEQHHGFRWLRGGVPVNHHLLSDFRWQAAEIADRLLTQGVAALWSEGLVTLASLSHDGIRIRASAGASSFRRLATLERLLAEVGQRIARLKQEIDADPDASNRRLQAARERAARERQQRIAAAAYNVQLTADLDSGVIVGLDVDTTGSDGGLLAPAAEQVEQRYGHCPQRFLGDGGFTRLDDITALARKAITVFCPLKPRRNPNNDPAKPRYGDPPEIADWRRRMVDDAAAGPASWMRRRGEHERVNANFRRQGLQQFNVRGTFKVKTVSVLHALANNIMAAVRLRTAAA